MKKRIVTSLLALAVVMGSVVSYGGSVLAAEETATVKWVLRTDEQKDDQVVMDELNKILLERYNLQLELIPVSGGEYDTRTQLITTSGEDYDIMWTSNWSNNFDANVNREAFMPLNDLLESEAGSALKECVPEWYFAAATRNGNIYAVPNNQIMANALAVVIQKEYVDKYGLDVESIKTIEDLVPFLEQIRDNEPDLIPMCETDSITAAGIDNARDYLTRFHYVDASDESLTLKSVFEDEDWMGWYKTMNEWYKDGLFRSDLLTIEDNSADLAANRYVCRVTAYKPSVAAEVSENYGKDYIAIPITGTYSQYSQPIGTMNAINVSSENAEAAVKFLGALYSDVEVYNTFMYGIEGVHYTKVSENRVEQIADSGYSRADIGWEFGSQFNQWLLPSHADDVWEATQAMNDSATLSPLTGFVLSQDNIQTEMANMNAVEQEYLKGMFTAEDFDAYMETVEEALVAAGADVVRDDYQSQINEWNASK